MTDRHDRPSGTTSDERPPELPADDQLDLGGVARALRRSRGLVVAIVAGATAVVLAISLGAPERYQTSARIAEDLTSVEGVDIATADRRLATSRELVTSPAVLDAAARLVPGETPGSLAGKVSARIDLDASLLDVVATDRDAGRTARIANAVAATFLEREQTAEAAALAAARERLTREIERQRGDGASRLTLAGLRERLSELAVTEALAGSRLRLVQPATIPSSPYAPRPLLSALLAFVVASIAAVLVALVRDRLRRPAPDALALSRSVALPLLAAVPVAGDRPLRRVASRLRLGPSRRAPVDDATIEEAALGASLRSALPPRVSRLVLLHDAGRDCGATRVAEGLARSLSWAGHATVLVCAEGDDRHAADPGVPVVQVGDPADIKRRDSRYAILATSQDSPFGDVRTVAPFAAAALLVAALGRTSAAEAASARRLIDAVGVHIVGLVVTCSPGEAAGIPREAFGRALRPPGRARTAAGNGTGHGSDAAVAVDLAAGVAAAE